MSELDLELGKYLEAHKQVLRRNASYLGKNKEDVLKDLKKESLLNLGPIGADSLSKLKEATQVGDFAVVGGASLWGAIRGGIDANVFFGADAGSKRFSGSMWTSPIGAGGGGAGAFSMVPQDGQQMNFTWAGGAFEGGGVAIFWNIGGTIVGGLSVVVAGLGVGGGDGSGTWTAG